MSAGRQFSCNIIPYFFLKLGKLLPNLSSAAVVIGDLRVNIVTAEVNQKIAADEILKILILH